MNDNDGAGQLELGSRAGRLVVATTVLGSAVAMLTATVVNVALPSIADDLDAGSSGQKWVINAYLLTLAALILVGGSLGDRYGRLRVYRLGVTWFAAASVACALAPSVPVLIGCRLLQGVGGALLTPGSLAIIEATLRPEDRGRGVGTWSGLTGVAGAIGPIVGGLLVELSWRWVFVINLPVAAAVLILSTRVPESMDPDAQDSRIDVVGAVLTVLALGAASYALIEGPEGGFSPLEIASAVVAVVAGIGLARYEPGREHAMVPIDLFAERAFAAANAITLLVYGGMGVVFFLLSVQLQVAAGWSPIAAGTALLPVTVLMLLLSSRAGDLAQRIGPRIPLTVGPLVMAAGLLLLVRVDADATYVGDVLPAVVVFGLGLSASVAPVTSTALGSVPDARSGAASGTNNAVSRTGQLLAVAAVPGIVGLTGDALNDPARLGDGFPPAMVLAAALVAAGGLTAAVMLRADDTKTRDAEPDESPARHHAHCPVDGSHPDPRRAAA